MLDKMEEEIKNLNSERYKILKMVEKFENKRKDLIEKMNKKGVSLEIETIAKETVIKHIEKPNTVSTEKSCWYYMKGYCKKGVECKYSHKSDDCSVHVIEGRCGDQKCNKRHRKDCKYWTTGFCFRRESCAYLHRTHKPESQLEYDVEKKLNIVKEE